MGAASCYSWPFSNATTTPTPLPWPIRTRISNLVYCYKKSKQHLFYSSLEQLGGIFGSGSRSTLQCHHGIKSVACSSSSKTRETVGSTKDDKDDEEREECKEENQQLRSSSIELETETDKETLGIVAACIVGLLTGVGVVLFNIAVHEIRDTFWDGIPSRGASWLREEPLEHTWQRVLSVPLCGGIVVSILNYLRSYLDTVHLSKSRFVSNAQAALKPFLKTLAASVTLGTGNSLGPEGPSVEIGASIAKGFSSLLEITNQGRLALVAAGSAAGISSGFNAAVAGCFFAVESVLWPSSADSASLRSTTSMVILSAVLASVVTEVGLGSQPAFKVPDYDFRSPTELPLYLLLGVLCGLVSMALSKCTSYALEAANNFNQASGIPKTLFPVLGSFAVGLMALAYPEILYWGFENVNLLLESQPNTKGQPVELLLQILGAKIVATSLCRASGLVGGYYAPSLFIGAATGMAYGKLAVDTISQFDPIYHLSYLEVASPQAYGLVGMAATLAGVCQVPLTAVLLLFELTGDYRIVLPLLGAVGMSSLIASAQTRKRDASHETPSSRSKTGDDELSTTSSSTSSVPSYGSPFSAFTSDSTDLCEMESSLCLDASSTDFGDLKGRISVSQAMRTRWATVLMNTLLSEAVAVMLAEKQSCSLIVDSKNFLVGVLTLEDIQEFGKSPILINGQAELVVSAIYHMKEGKRRLLWAATPDMSLLAAQSIMNAHGLNQLPVISKDVDSKRSYPVGLLDRECIDLACRIIAMQDFLDLSASGKGQ
ncbi:hypothetical protein Scep_030651 [Stephania cephalantha]|uniref:Chloride channel protein n=1 Tax=Stephania cephalantha TaxID=152367 RepID=A0AAP0HIT6_9MAGN